ncbi:MAG TPA: hypothetical protein VHT34_03745 [Clostridia bacterium]|nr:hypothetical protein [Clostridia bacterium]
MFTALMRIYLACIFSGKASNDFMNGILSCLPASSFTIALSVRNSFPSSDIEYSTDPGRKM